MYRDEDCFGDELVALSNLTGGVAHERKDRIMASQGDVFCEIYATDGPARIERYVWRNDPDPTYVEVLNVSCQIYPQTSRQTDAVERALRRLPGVRRLPTTVPSADAVHDPRDG